MNPSVIYDLFATVNHFGSLDKGHYTANVKKDEHWYAINDEFVADAGEICIEKGVLSSDQAYMLFYSRRH
jgi:ubiquitin C-terminal hydrolase